MNVFVLDDNKARLSIFENRFAGYTVVTATNYVDACQLLGQSSRFDIAYLDFDLGEIARETGADVAAFIMTLDPLRRPKRVVIHSQFPGGAQAIEAILRSDSQIIVTREPFTTF